ncbi:MAG: hypothetical protein KF684_10280, partial [Phycisphaeraceae bacterium]|nr:hypothetical protein [Phycisphaeraceae bacterium]
AVEASPSLLCQLGLQSQGHDRQGQKLTRFGSGDAPHLYNGLSTLLHEDGATLVVTVASVSEKCERWWVFEDKTKALSEAARLALSDAKLGANDAPAATFSQLHTTWQAVRQEMKPVLEELIQSLSKRTFETFEEKAEVAARLNELLDEWRFRAVSPSTGRASYFQCRVGERNPKGYFFFQDIDPGSSPQDQTDASAPRAPSQVPIFKLTEAPVDPRLRKPNHQPNPRKKRKN